MMPAWLSVLTVVLIALTAGLAVVVGVYGPTAGLRLAAWCIRKRFPEVPQWSPQEVLAWSRDGTDPLLVIDARSAAEFEVSHLPGALRFEPDSNLAPLLDQIGTKRVVAYCSAGYRSSLLARRLREAGVGKAGNLEGSIFAWSNAGLPLVRAGQPTREVHPFNSFGKLFLKKPEAPAASEPS
jgi:rhodanese-related sulfurtransferase